MTCEEFSNEFDLFYNNIMSNQAPGLNEYEKSVFLTKAQDDIIKKYFTLKGNKYNENFDGSIKRNIDFSKLYNTFSLSYILLNQQQDIHDFLKTDYEDFALEYVSEINPNKSCFTISKNIGLKTLTFNITEKDLNKVFSSKIRISTWEDRIISADLPYDSETPIKFSEIIDLKSPTNYYIKNIVSFNYSNLSDLFLPIQDELLVYDEVAKQERLLQIQPLDNLDYIKKMSKPFKQPTKNQAWKIQTKAINNHNSIKLIYGYNNDFIEYNLRYIKRPTPIILTAIGEENLSIRGYVGGINNEETPVSLGSEISPNKGLTCLLDEEIHEEILQRAVELAKVAYSGNLGDSVQLGNMSGTNIGIIPTAQQQQQ